MSHHDHQPADHPFHLVNPSPLPFAASMSMLALTLGAAFYFHDHAVGLPLMLAGFAGVIACMYFWWKGVIREGIHDHAHTPAVQHGLRFGMALFITSEVMFFVAFFWAFISAAVLPKIPLSDTWDILQVYNMWPPAGIVTLDAFDIPLINTLILLLSGTTVTWAHHAVIHGNQKEATKALALTVFLGVCFTALQAYEYHHAAFGFTDGVYASTFYMATGFHGAHVIIGTIFLFVMLVRSSRGTLTPQGHLGFEFAAWYWHFVDVVWLFLFITIYWWGS